MKIEIGLSGKERGGVIELLSLLLADHYVLYTKARKFHWNVTGPSFSELHKFFETLYEALAGQVDEIAERIRALGEVTPATLKEFLDKTRLEEQVKNPDAKGMLQKLLSDYETLIQILRKDVETATKLNDAGTADFLTGLMEGHEKTAWMLRSYLQS